MTQPGQSPPPRSKPLSISALIAWLGQGWRQGWHLLLRRWQRLGSIVVLTITIIALGNHLAQAVDTADITVGTVDPVAVNLRVGHDLYLEHCSTCHIAVPPAVMPRQVWETLLADTAHYSVTLTLLPRFDSQLIWNYLKTYSRPHEGSRIVPFRLSESRFFEALHPDVQFEQPPRLNTCVSCHPGAESFNFRDWQE